MHSVFCSTSKTISSLHILCKVVDKIESHIYMDSLCLTVFEPTIGQNKYYAWSYCKCRYEVSWIFQEVKHYIKIITHSFNGTLLA